MVQTAPGKTMDLAEYLFRRIRQCGVQSIHGVPGDYNLAALDYIPKAGIRWMGSVNELNAGYAADGYARVRGLGVIVTTFGVGELSAANALAGSFSECIPVLHIVGTPSTDSQRHGMLLHHTLGNGDFTVFSRIGAELSCSQAAIKDGASAPALIDKLIRDVVLQSRPGYLTLPSDLVHAKVDASGLDVPLDFSFEPNDQQREEYAVAQITSALAAAQKPIILVDACAYRHRAVAETIAFVKASRLPTFVTPMSKSVVDEDLSNFGGVYAGTASEPGVRAFVEDSDLVLSIGSLQTDFNTAGFSVRLSALSMIELHSNLVRDRYAEFPGIRMNGVLTKLTAAIDAGSLRVRNQVSPTDSLSLKLSPDLSPAGPITTMANKPNKKEIPSITRAQKTMAKAAGRAPSTVVNAPDTILHDYFWSRIGNWLQTDDVVVTETGTSSFGIWSTKFPAGVRAINQVLWGSIGYATPAAIGASTALEDDRTGLPPASLMAPNGGTRHKAVGEGRTVLFTGDGSFQLTAQELATAIRHGLCPIIFLIQNKGFTIERFIHGAEAEYNDISEWDYVGIPKVFGADVLPAIPAQFSSMANKAQVGTEKLEKKMREYWNVGTSAFSGSNTSQTSVSADPAAVDATTPQTQATDGSVTGASTTTGPGSTTVKKRKAKVWRIKTRTELEALLTDEVEWADNKCLRFIEIHMPWDDAPEAMIQTGESASALNDKLAA